MNLYRAVGNNAVNYGDPKGLEIEYGWAHGVIPTPDVSDSVSIGVGAMGGAGDFVGAYIDQWWATNVVGRAHNGWVNQDKYFHCRANCEAAQRGKGGAAAAKCMSDAREEFDQGWPKYDSPEWSASDQAANQFGRAGGAANPTGDCRQICGRYRPGGSFPSKF